MHLVELLLPVRDESGRPFPRKLYDTLVSELTDRFGGLTTHTRAPAVGLWEEGSERTVRDDVVVYEVMAAELDEGWWKALRGRLEKGFRQDELVVRAHEIRRL